MEERTRKPSAPPLKPESADRPPGSDTRRSGRPRAGRSTAVADLAPWTEDARIGQADQAVLRGFESGK